MNLHGVASPERRRVRAVARSGSTSGSHGQILTVSCFVAHLFDARGYSRVLHGTGEVPRGEKMLYSRTDPASYIIKYTSVYEEWRGVQQVTS